MLKSYFLVGEALSVLFYPYVEVVVHDLKTGKIAAIYNSYSKRQVGGDSLLQEEELIESDSYGPYEKVNVDGRPIKSMSVVLRDKHEKAVGMFCVNLDVSLWKQLGQQIQTFLEHGLGAKPDVLFKDDWQERINIYVAEYLRQESVSINHLSSKQRKDLIHHLHDQGAFEAKNAAQYVANALGVGRATVYNDLRRK